MRSKPSDPSSFLRCQYIHFDKNARDNGDSFDLTFLNNLVDVQLSEVHVEYDSAPSFQDTQVAVDFGRRFRDFETHQPTRHGNRVLVTLECVEHGTPTFRGRIFKKWQAPRLDDEVWTKRIDEKLDFNLTFEKDDGNTILDWRIVLKVKYIDKK